jgi:hypothetical protein
MCWITPECGTCEIWDAHSDNRAWLADTMEFFHYCHKVIEMFERVVHFHFFELVGFERLWCFVEIEHLIHTWQFYDIDIHPSFLNDVAATEVELHGIIG